jgi:NTP pyrophosphatase (non-canonical NTP hydrolase)
MTTLAEIMEFQRKFDDAHGWRWSAEPNKKMDKLKDGTICLAGEVGEFANVLKKIVRHSERSMPDGELWASLRDELTDVFIYLIKLADLLEVELDKSYFEKMSTNARRFEGFRCQNKQVG